MALICTLESSSLPCLNKCHRFLADALALLCDRLIEGVAVVATSKEVRVLDAQKDIDGKEDPNARTHTPGPQTPPR